MSLITKDSYRADVHNFTIESLGVEEVPMPILFNKDGTVKNDPCTKHTELFDLTINNVISWEYLKMKFTKDELKGLADFIYETIGEKK